KLSGTFSGAVARANFVRKVIVNHSICKITMAVPWRTETSKSRFARQINILHNAITWCNCKNGQCAKREV
ncbi:PIPO, partial [Shallot mild yellow stripe virus]